MEKRRYHFIDMMEFVGMLCVLIYHATLFPYNFPAAPGVGLYRFYYVLRMRAPFLLRQRLSAAGGGDGA